MSSKSTDKEATISTVNVDPVNESGETAKKETKPAEQKAEKAAKVVQEATTEEKKESVKAEEKTPRAKRTYTKKIDKPDLKPEVYIEYHGTQVLESAIVDKVKTAFVSSGHRVSSIKALQLYIKPEEAKAYYVINEGKYTGDVDLY